MAYSASLANGLGLSQLSSAPAAPSVPDPRAGNWKRLTEQANFAYAQGDMPLALAIYEEALTEAEKLIDAQLGESETIPVPVMYNISCHNLAELFERSGEIRKAEHYYQLAYDRLMRAAQTPATTLPMRISCLQHLKHALAVLVRHLEQQGDPDRRIGSLISEAHQVAYTVFQVAQHASQADETCSPCTITQS